MLKEINLRPVIKYFNRASQNLGQRDYSKTYKSKEVHMALEESTGICIHCNRQFRYVGRKSVHVCQDSKCLYKERFGDWPVTLAEMIKRQANS